MKTNAPGSADLPWLWSGIVLRTTLGTVLNPGLRLSEETMTALTSAVSQTLWLDSVIDLDAPPAPVDSVGAGFETFEKQNELDLWDRATVALVDDFGRLGPNLGC